MPAPRIKEHARAKKGTMKRLVKSVFELYPFKLLLCALCIIFNVFANLCSSVFAGLITGVLTEALRQNGGPFNVMDFTRTYPGVTVMGGIKLPDQICNVPILLCIMGGIYLVGVFCAWWYNREMAIITQLYMNQFRKALFNHMEDLPIVYFDRHPHGEIMSIYTNDIDTIRQFISQSLPEFLRTGLSVFFSLTLMLINSVWMTLIVLLGCIAMIMNTKVIGGRSAKFFVKQQKALGIVEGNIEESIKGLKVIKVFSHEEKSIEDFDKLNNELGQYSTQANTAGNITMPINGNIGNFTYVLTALVGVLMFVIPGFKNLTISNGLIDMCVGTNPEFAIQMFSSTIVTFLMVNRMFTNNVSQFSQQITFIVMGMAGASRCFDLMDEEKEKDEGYVYLCNIIRHKDGTFEETSEHTHDYAWKYLHKDGHLEYKELKGDILLDHVDFSYNLGHLILKDVSIYAHPGQSIALVGATGAGKTTITNLINRFYDIEPAKLIFAFDSHKFSDIKRFESFSNMSQSKYIDVSEYVELTNDDIKTFLKNCSLNQVKYEINKDQTILKFSNSDNSYYYQLIYNPRTNLMSAVEYIKDYKKNAEEKFREIDYKTLLSLKEYYSNSAIRLLTNKERDCIIFTKEGKVRYDGININKIKKADLRKSLGIVLQDTNLFTGTVMENIRYGRLDATDEEVYEAAKIANAYDFITRLPQGFNTMINGDGSNLSQGQRQLLSIARAAVADAPVMILDEATSSIDTRTEKLVQEGMDGLMKGRTVFVIAHRLSTVQNSNAIMVLKDGEIIERGDHKDLIAQKGLYYQLYTGAFELE